MTDAYRLLFCVFQDYIKALIDVMEQAEDLESLPDLHAMHGIIQTIRESLTSLFMRLLCLRQACQGDAVIPCAEARKNRY